MQRDLWLLLSLVACHKDESISGCDGDVPQLFVDEDGDSYGSKTIAQDACELGPGLADNSSDCNDADASVHPGATEVCNDVDDDCDGTAASAPEWYVDADGDGYGAIGSATPACDAPKGFVADGSDCDDTDSAVNPAAAESCENEYDDDCDGVTAVATDDDGDGYLSDACAGGPDCDDADATIHPGAVETCGDGIDSNCDLVDGACSFAGEYDMADADAEATTNKSNAWVGNELDSGDVTGDGIDDVLIAGVHIDTNIGGGFVLSGAPVGSVSLEHAGFYFASGTETWGAGRSIGVGDVDGDGIADVAFGAPYVDAQGQFIVFGPITGDVDLPTEHDVSLSRGADGSGSYCGHGSDLGDVNGDGLEDSVIGAYMDDTNGTAAGKVYVTFAPFADDVDLETEADVAIVGENEWGYPGRAVKAGKDINGDGIGDIVLNATYDSTGAPQAGGAYVVYGPVTVNSLADAPMLTGPVMNAFAGNGITFGDYDGDGFADVVVSVDIPGAVAIVRGPIPDGVTSLAKADVVLDGTTSPYFGYGLGTGDLENDGVDELLIGDPGANTGGSSAGIVYLVADPPTGTSVVDDVASATFLGEDMNDGSGSSVEIADLDGNGDGDIVIGAYQMSVGGGIDIFYAD
jgi:hypothetical protein